MTSMRGRSAFTVIETLVVIAVVGIIAALLLMAVQSAREAARRAVCANNLRQIGVALQSYSSTHQNVPNGLNGNRFSIHVMILPYVEQNSLYDSINMNLSPSPGPDEPNGTAYKASVSVYLCPSDGAEFPAAQGTNYAGSLGYGSPRMGGNGFFIHPQNQPNSPSPLDGASNTLALSEWLRGQDTPSSPTDIRRAVIDSAYMPVPEEFARSCRNAPTDSSKVPGYRKGLDWLSGQLGSTLYNHTLTPNSNTCMNGGQPPISAWTASSNHAGGVNVLYADGHVRWVTSDIDLNHWRALGTRNGGEVVSGDLR